MVIVRFLRNLLITIAVLVGLVAVGVVATDGMLRGELEKQAATQVEDAAGFDQPPTVTLEGYPLAWHLLLQEVPAVRIQGDALSATLTSGATARLTAVDLTFTRVWVQPRSVEAGSVSGSTDLSYADVGALAGLEVAPAEEGRVTFTSDATVLGRTVAIHVTGRLVVDEAAQTVSMVDAAIDVAGVSVPTQVSQPVVDARLAPVHVPLPYGLRLTGIAPHADAVTLQVGGEGVSVPLTR